MLYAIPKHKRRRFKIIARVKRQSSIKQIKSAQNYLKVNDPNYLQANTVIFD